MIPLDNARSTASTVLSSNVFLVRDSRRLASVASVHRRGLALHFEVLLFSHRGLTGCAYARTSFDKVGYLLAPLRSKKTNLFTSVSATMSLSEGLLLSACTARSNHNLSLGFTLYPIGIKIGRLESLPPFERSSAIRAATPPPAMTIGRIKGRLSPMQISWKVWAAGGALLLLSGLGTATYVYGGEPKRKGVNRDPQRLLPPFAKKLNKLFRAMRARGFKPMLWEGRRAAQRAAELAKKGTGITLSMHTLGAAGDIVDGSTDNPWKASPGFWTALGQEAAKLGLTWGGKWTKRDFPHIQALAVSDQGRFRRMSVGERTAFIA